MNTLKKFMYFTSFLLIMPFSVNASDLNPIQIVKQINVNEYEISLNDGSQFLPVMLQTDNIIQPENSGISESTVKYELGIAVGTPALLNLVTAIHFGIHGVKLSGFAFPNGNYGFQLDYVYKFGETADMYHALNAGFGTYYWKSVCRIPDYEENITIDKSTFGGLAYNFNYYGIYIQAGLNLNLSKSESIQPMGQIGYVYKF